MSTQSNIREGLGLPTIADAIVQVIETNEETPQDVLKRYIVINEDIKALEGRLDALKPIVDSFREGDKKKFFQGQFRNVKGQFCVNHVEGKKSSLDTDMVKKYLTEEQFNSCLKLTEYEYNLVNFKKS